MNVDAKHQILQELFSRKLFLWFPVIVCILLVALNSNTAALRLQGRQRYPTNPPRRPTLHFDTDIDRNSSHERFKMIPSYYEVKPEIVKRVKQELNVGIVLPKSNFRKRDYNREIRESLSQFEEGANASVFTSHYEFSVENIITRYMEASSSPTSKYH